jgi:hypothetical protein
MSKKTTKKATIKQQVRTILKGSISIPLALGAGMTELAAEAVDPTVHAIQSAVKHGPRCAKQVVLAPFDAGTGWIVQNEGITEAEAEERSYKYLRQDAVKTIKDISVGSGKLMAKAAKAMAEE